MRKGKISQGSALSKPRQTLLPFVGGLILIETGRRKAAGAFLDLLHIVEAHVLLALPVATGRLEDGFFRFHTFKKSESPTTTPIK